MPCTLVDKYHHF